MSGPDDGLSEHRLTGTPPASRPAAVAEQCFDRPDKFTGPPISGAMSSQKKFCPHFAVVLFNFTRANRTRVCFIYTILSSSPMPVSFTARNLYYDKSFTCYHIILLTFKLLCTSKETAGRDHSLTKAKKVCDICLGTLEFLLATPLSSCPLSLTRWWKDSIEEIVSWYAADVSHALSLWDAQRRFPSFVSFIFFLLASNFRCISLV